MKMSQIQEKNRESRTDWKPRHTVYAAVGILSFNVGGIFSKGGDNLDNGGLHATAITTQQFFPATHGEFINRRPDE